MALPTAPGRSGAEHDTLDGARPLRAENIFVGKVLAGRLRVEEHLGSGGMGQVWRAHDQEVNETVAMKVVPPAVARDTQRIENIRHEAGVRGSAEGFYEKVSTHLRRILQLLPRDRSEEAPGFPGGRMAREQCPPKADASDYLQRVASQTDKIRIHGLEVGTDKAMLLPIDQLYIRLTTTRARGAGPDEGRGGKLDEGFARGEGEAVDLREALTDRCLVVVGDPGAGKSTFVQRVAAG